MGKRVLGMETEYAVSGQMADGAPLDKAFLANELVQLAAHCLASLPSGGNGGLFLANGSRFYRDAGNHPEVSTPECLTPWEVVRYVAAGDRIMRELSNRLCERIGPGTTVNLAKVNVDYSGSGNTWGCHESYSHAIPDRGFFEDLIPHLISRIVYTGAGGFNSISPGLEFAISPRVHHIVKPVSDSSTNSRGIVHTKNEDLTGGTCNRLHLLCGESLFSQTAAVLKVGTTALVLAMLEHGTEDFSAWRPARPVEAMKTIGSDPTCRAAIRLTTGARVSALEIQDCYLSRIENQLGADWLPEWAEDLCRLWRHTLVRLEGAPESVCDSLDWAIKYVFFEKLKSERGFDAATIGRWNEFQDLMIRRPDDESGTPRPRLLNAMLAPTEEDCQLELITAQQLHEQGLDRGELRRFRALRRDLFMLDTRFHTVDADCIFAALQRAGVLNHEVPGVGDIDGATTDAPNGTRAHLRGKAIKLLSGKKGENLCGWDFVSDQIGGRQLNLRDPFDLEERWEPITSRSQVRPRFLDLHPQPRGFLHLLRELDL